MAKGTEAEGKERTNGKRKKEISGSRLPSSKTAIDVFEQPVYRESKK